MTLYLDIHSIKQLEEERNVIINLSKESLFKGN